MSEHSSKHPFFPCDCGADHCVQCGHPKDDPDVHAQAEPNPPHHKWATIRHRSEAEPKPAEITAKWSTAYDNAVYAIKHDSPFGFGPAKVRAVIEELSRAQQRIASLEAELAQKQEKPPA